MMHPLIRADGVHCRAVAAIPAADAFLPPCEIIQTSQDNAGGNARPP